MRFLDPILASPLPSCIKVLEGETIRINTLMAGIADLVILMLLDLFANRSSLLAVFGLDGLNAFRRRRKCVAGNILGNPGNY